MLTLIDLDFKEGTDSKVQNCVRAEVRKLLPTQHWTSSFAYSFYCGKDDNKDDIRDYCKCLIAFFTRHAPRKYLDSDCSLSTQYVQITEENSDTSNLACRFVNCSDLKAMFGSFFDEHKAPEQRLLSVAMDYTFVNVALGSVRSNRQSQVRNHNSFVTAGEVPITRVGPRTIPHGMSALSIFELTQREETVARR